MVGIGSEVRDGLVCSVTQLSRTLSRAASSAAVNTSIWQKSCINALSWSDSSAPISLFRRLAWLKPRGIRVFCGEGSSNAEPRHRTFCIARSPLLRILKILSSISPFGRFTSSERIAGASHRSTRAANRHRRFGSCQLLIIVLREPVYRHRPRAGRAARPHGNEPQYLLI